MKQTDMRVIATVMGEPDSTTRNNEVSSMLDYAFAQVGIKKVLSKNSIVEKISLSKLSELCFISEATLRRYFYEYVKMSPHQYIHKVRMKHAKIMLATSQTSIIDIALSTGYPTISSFNRQFLKQYNISPSTYRKQKEE